MIELLTVRDVAGLIRCSTRTVWRLRDLGRLPAPIQVGTRTGRGLVRWRLGDIEKWLSDGATAVAKEAVHEE